MLCGYFSLIQRGWRGGRPRRTGAFPVLGYRCSSPEAATALVCPSPYSSLCSALSWSGCSWEAQMELPANSWVSSIHMGLELTRSFVCSLEKWQVSECKKAVWRGTCEVSFDLELLEAGIWRGGGEEVTRGYDPGGEAQLLPPHSIRNSFHHLHWHVPRFRIEFLSHPNTGRGSMCNSWFGSPLKVERSPGLIPFWNALGIFMKWGNIRIELQRCWYILNV